MQIPWGTEYKYHEIVKKKGYLNHIKENHKEAELSAVLEPGVQAPRHISTIETLPGSY